MQKIQEYWTESGRRYFHVDRKPPTIWQSRAEFGALLGQLYVDTVRDRVHYGVAGFIPNIADAFVSRECKFNPYATVLLMALCMLDREVYTVAPIHDMSNRDEIFYIPSATLAENMALSPNKEERKQVYSKLAKKIRTNTHINLKVSNISSHFEDAEERGYFEPAKTIVDWLYSTLYHSLSDKMLMTSPLDIRAVEDVLLPISYASLAAVIEAGQDRSVALEQRNVVIANLDENKYLLSLPRDLRETGEKPVLINRE